MESSHVFLLFLCGEATPEAAQPSGKRRSRVAYMADRKGRGRLPGIGPLGVASPARLDKGTVATTQKVGTGGAASALGYGSAVLRPPGDPEFAGSLREFSVIACLPFRL